MDGKTYDISVPVDGIALSPDGQYLFYTPLGGVKLYQLKTSAVREVGHGAGTTPATLPVRELGEKPSQTNGMVMGYKRLYFGSLSLNAIHVWEYKKDMISQHAALGDVNMTTVHELAEDGEILVWPDGFDLDDSGYLWVTTNKLPKFWSRELDIGQEQNIEKKSHFRLARVKVDDIAYKAKCPGWTGAIWFYGLLLLASVIIFLLLGLTQDQKPTNKRNNTANRPRSKF